MGNEQAIEWELELELDEEEETQAERDYWADRDWEDDGEDASWEDIGRRFERAYGA